MLYIHRSGIVMQCAYDACRVIGDRICRDVVQATG